MPPRPRLLFFTSNLRYLLHYLHATLGNGPRIAISLFADCRPGLTSSLFGLVLERQRETEREKQRDMFRHRHGLLINRNVL